MVKIISNEQFKQAWKNEDNLKIIRKVLKGFKKQISDKDELLQCGREGLWWALRYYSPDHLSKTKFTSYLYSIVTQFCIKSLKTQQQTKLEYIDEINYDKYYLEKNKWDELIDGLQEKEKELLKDRFINKYSFYKLSEKYSVNISKIQKILNNILLKLKKGVC